MDSSVLLKDQIWFLHMCHHVSNVLYTQNLSVWFCYTQWPKHMLLGITLSTYHAKNIICVFTEWGVVTSAKAGSFPLTVGTVVLWVFYEQYILCLIFKDELSVNVQGLSLWGIYFAHTFLFYKFQFWRNTVRHANGCITPLIRNLSERCRWVANFMPWPGYPPRKNPHYPLNSVLVGSGHGAPCLDEIFRPSQMSNPRWCLYWLYCLTLQTLACCLHILQDGNVSVLASEQENWPSRLEGRRH